MFDSLFQDLRYGIRSLTARPAFTVAALLTLALAIGANTLVFSLIDGIYLTPLPYRDDARLVDVENRYPSMGLDATGASIPDYLDRRAGVPALVESALYTQRQFQSRDRRRARARARHPRDAVACSRRSASPRARPRVQRRRSADRRRSRRRARRCDVAQPLQRRSGHRRPRCSPQRRELQGHRRDAGGLHVSRIARRSSTSRSRSRRSRNPTTNAASSFRPASRASRPARRSADVKQQADLVIRRNLDRIGAVGGDGASFAQFMKSAGFTVNVRPLRTLLAGEHSRMLLLLQLAVGLVLLIACANIANLSADAALGASEGTFGAHGARREPHARRAPAADRSRAARARRRRARRRLRRDRPASRRHVGPAARLGFARTRPARAPVHARGRRRLPDSCSASRRCCPPASASRSRCCASPGRLGGGGRQARAVRSTLVVVQIALAVALLASAGLLVRSFAKVVQESPGFESNGVLTAAIALPKAKYPDDAARAAVMARFLDAARNLPGVVAAGLADARADLRRQRRLELPHRRPAEQRRDAARVRAHRPMRITSRRWAFRSGRGAGSKRATGPARTRSPSSTSCSRSKRFPNGDAVGQVLDLERPGVTDRSSRSSASSARSRTAISAKTSSRKRTTSTTARCPTDTVALILRTSGPPAALVAAAARSDP